MNNMPKKIKRCPNCGNSEVHKWDHGGRMEYPAKYANARTMRLALERGDYTWNAGKETFGVDVYTCHQCGTTNTDVSE